MSILASFIFWLFWLVFFTITWSHVLVKEATGWWSGCANCFGDWAAHLTYTTSFAFGQNWPPQLPIMAGHKFSYPFLIDWLSAMLIKMGLDIRLALIIPGWILSLVLIWLIVKLGQKLTGSLMVGRLASFIFLFIFGKKFLNIVVAQLVPQRGWLPGMSLAIIIYLLLWRKKPLYAGIFAGLLPLIHAHSYLATMAIGVWAGWQFMVPALILGLPQTFLAYSPGLNLLKFNPQWLGLEPVLIIILGIIGFGLAGKKLKKFSLPFWGLFILANLFTFQPFDWDNTKIFDHWLLIATILASLTLKKMWQKSWQLKIAAIVLFCLMTWPGLKETIKFNQYEKNKYLFFDNRQLALAEIVKKTIPPQAVILTASNHNHWLPSLTGRKIVLGYSGWLWSYGISYQQREGDVKLIYQTADKALMDKYKINYVLVGPEERRQFLINEDLFKQQFPAIELTPDSALYQYAP